MGAAASVGAAATASEVAAAVTALGDAYGAYASKVEAEGIDGAFLQETTADDLAALFDDLGVTSNIHKKKLAVIFKSFKVGESEGGDGPEGAVMPAAEAKSGDDGMTLADLKAYAAFLSHFKFECGTEARLVQQNLKGIIEQNPLKGSKSNVFLDSDDLSDLRNLLEYVKNTQVLVLLQSKRVLTRPWVILEIWTALTNEVPIVALNVQNAFPYDYAEAMDFLLHFDDQIEIANPGAAALLVDMGVDPVDVAWRLSDSLPNIISTEFNPNASEKVLNASLEDLVDSMQKAKPIAPSMTKEEWLEKRKVSKSTAAKKAHGSADARSSGGGAASGASASKGLATVPSTVPELPAAYLARAADINSLKEALLAKEGAATAKAGAKKSNKVGAHGMGGVGKTTIAAALLTDTEIRSAFEKICWVSVGQDPDIRTLQDSIHIQLTDTSLPDTVKADGEVSAALRNAAAGKDVLLVVDDVWDSGHEKVLCCIDPDNGSRELVTTRIRGLLKQSAEVDVGVLSEGEALELLVSSADMDMGEVEEGSDEHRIAKEIVELCGKLPLTLAIAGGMISDNPDGFTDDVVEMMKEDRLREQEDEDEMTLEERVITTSLKMIKGKNKDNVLSIFKFFAVFAEDVPVPAGFFNVFAPMLTGEKEKKAKMTVGNCLSMLLKYNLIKGSLSMGHGVFMHDIVRDYVINQHTEDDLCALQKTVVKTILAARPKGGFSFPQYAPTNSFDHWIGSHLWHHLRGALEEGQEAPDEWLIDPDDVVKMNTSRSFRGGLDEMAAIIDSREAAGDLVRAAYVARIASLAKGVDSERSFDFLYRAQALLEQADNKDVLEYEKYICDQCSFKEFGSERNNKARARQSALVGGSGSYEDVMNEGMALGGSAMMKLGIFGSEVDQESIDAGIQEFHAACQKWVDAASLPDIPLYLKGWCEHLESMVMFTMFGGVAYRDPNYSPNMCGATEEGAVAAVETWKSQQGGVYLQNKFGFDLFQCGVQAPPLGLSFGNLDAMDMTFEKILVGWQQLDLPKSKQYGGSTALELFNYFMGNLPTFIWLERRAAGKAFLEAAGFSGWNKDSFDGMSSFAEHVTVSFPGVQKDPEVTFMRLALFLCDDEGTIQADEVNAWILAPSALAEINANYVWLKRGGLYDTVSFGAMAYLKLGRDDDAYELCKIAVSPEQKTEKGSSLSRCYSILGRIAAKRGCLDEAAGHFANALKEAQAKCTMMPMFEVLAARDWKKFLLEPNERDPSAADAAIDAACAKMKKTREQLSSVLFE